MSESDPHSSLSRRQLLERAGIAGAAVVFPGLVPRTQAAEAALASAATAAAGRHGTLRVGLLFGAHSTNDPHATASPDADFARNFNVFNKLTDFDARGKLVLQLAESIEASKDAKTWVVKLRKGVTFHDGSPLTPEDVIYSYRRILNKKFNLEGYVDLSMIDPNGFKKLDAHTLRIRLKFPYSDFASQVGQRTTAIIKAGTTSFNKLNGTGPFKFKRMTSQEMILEANPHYWVSGKPHLAAVRLINISDETARVNALRSAQVDAIELVPSAQLKVIRGDRRFRAVISQSGQWVPFVMDTSVPPFNDNRVRLAVRLLANRRQIVNQALGGFGTVGNDLFGRFDPLYAHDIPQIKHDPERAKSLLKAAGVDLKATLAVADVATGMLNAGIVFSQQAQKEGVNINVGQASADTYWDQTWAKVPFYGSLWANRPLMAQYIQILLPNSPYPEPHWKDPATTKLFNQAMRTPNFRKRKALMHSVQEILWNKSAYLIWGFPSSIDAHRSNVHGFGPNVNRPLNAYHFENISISR